MKQNRRRTIPNPMEHRQRREQAATEAAAHRPRRAPGAVPTEAGDAIARMAAAGLTVDEWSDSPPAAYSPEVMQWLIGKADAHRVNAYVCEVCKQVTITVDRHPGVTPAFVSHGMLGVECEGVTASAFYRVRPEHAAYATYEWYRPSNDELEGYRRTAAAPRPIGNETAMAEWAMAGGTVEHVLQGGLLLRRITAEADAKPHLSVVPS